MRWLWSAVPALVVAWIGSASAQEQSVNRTAAGQPNTDIRVGVYVNVRPDCSNVKTSTPAKLRASGKTQRTPALRPPGIACNW
jgi:hypothetical protein